MHLKGYQLSILLILLGIVLFAAAATTLVREYDSIVLPAKISLSESNLFALKKDNNCLISIEVNWKKQPEGGSLFLVGHIPSNVNNSMPLLKGELSFNQFDQLFGSFIEFPKFAENDNRFLKVGSQGVTPIELTILGQIFDRPLSLKVSVTGPITLVRIKDSIWISVPKTHSVDSDRYQNQINTNNISFVNLNHISECTTDGNLEFNMPDVVKSLSSIIKDLKGNNP